MSIEAMKQALEAFKKIHEGCGFVKKDNLSKESNELATLVRKDCNFAMEDLRQAIAEAEKPWVSLTDEEIKEIIGPWGPTPIKGYTRKLFDQIEAKLKEKNHG
jgi:hypothetical protein